MSGIDITTDTNNIGGFDFDEVVRKWPAGSVWANEGQRLYSLVREHRPIVIVEVGTNFGCSTSHLAMACRDNGAGHVYSFDNWQQIGDSTGSLIPAELKPWITLERRDAMAFDFRLAFPAGVDLLFEDGAHTAGFTRTILQNCPAKIVAVHDYSHFTAGAVVAPESREVLGEPSEVFFEKPADCGIAIWICK